MDESIFPVAPYLTYGWFKVGSRPDIRYIQNPREKFCILGARTVKEFIYELTEENIDSEVFKTFLAGLMFKFSRLFLVMDHVPYHASRDMQRFYEDNKDRLHVEYFPSYSPQLDPMENSWRELKKWLAIRNWENKDELKTELESGLKQGFIMTPIYDYLLP